MKASEMFAASSISSAIAQTRANRQNRKGWKRADKIGKRMNNHVQDSLSLRRPSPSDRFARGYGWQSALGEHHSQRAVVILRRTYEAI